MMHLDQAVRKSPNCLKFKCIPFNEWRLCKHTLASHNLNPNEGNVI